MNAERLHAIVKTLDDEMESNSIVDNMQNLVNALQSVVNNPTPSNQQSLSTSLKAMYSAITDTPSDRFSPTWRQILIEIGGEPLFGETLKQTIEGIFARNQITPAVALQELQDLLKKLKSFDDALDNAISALSHFNIGDETLSPGASEIGILIPRQAVQNSLPEFAEELTELAFILNTFSEVATGKKDQLSIRSISSSDLLLFLDATAPYAACLAVAIERTVALYKQLLEIRKLRNDLRKQGVPEAETSGIENYANQLMENGIKKLATEIVDQFYKKKDEGRKNELRNSVTISLNRLATRIDNGFNLEVRVEPLDTKDQEAKQATDLTNAIQLIQAASKNMQFLKLDGKPILKLPEGKRKKKGKAGGGATKPTEESK
jgi:hypothetical protein